MRGRRPVPKRFTDVMTHDDLPVLESLEPLDEVELKQRDGLICDHCGRSGPTLLIRGSGYGAYLCFTCMREALEWLMAKVSHVQVEGLFYHVSGKAD